MTTEPKPFCGKCGAPRVDTADKFCPDCGAPYATSAPTAVINTPVVEPTPVEAPVTPSEEPKPVRYNKEPSVSSEPAAAESQAPAGSEKPGYVSSVLLGFAGTATRGEYLGGYAIALFMGFVVTLLGAGNNALVFWSIAGWVISHYLFASVTAARMRDAGQNPQWAWLVAVPFAVTILLIWGLIAPTKQSDSAGQAVGNRPAVANRPEIRNDKSDQLGVPREPSQVGQEDDWKSLLVALSGGALVIVLLVAIAANLT